ncbi:MAG: hypothetical protein ABIT38_06085, partial [Gemmatimonadaceae bacterium]
MLIVTALGLLAQLAAPVDRRLPVLSFPEAGLDDTAAYRGYMTRLFRDAAGNTLQIYLDRREGRVVHIMADADNASIGFSARDARGAPASISWNGEGGVVSRIGRSRTFEYALRADASELQLGWPVLGSMRVERDFQAWGKHKLPYTAPRFILDEYQRLFNAIGQLPAPAQAHHLALLGAPDLASLRRRAEPIFTTASGATSWSTRIVQASLDGRDTLALELRVDPHAVAASRNENVVTLRPRAGSAIPFTVRVTTTAAALTPLTRQEIFTPEFLAYLASARA